MVIAGLAFPGAQAQTLIELATPHVQAAEKSRDTQKLWGRIGGSEAERASARILHDQLKPYVDRVTLEDFTFNAHRPDNWKLETDSGLLFTSAMPAPFDARFPLDTPLNEVVNVTGHDDWTIAKDKWAFAEAKMPYGPARTSVRIDLLYQKAIAAGSTGFIFSLPTPPGQWQVVVPVDKPYSKPDTFFENSIRPIPSFCIDAEDGARLKEAIETNKKLSSAFSYPSDIQQQALNTVGYLEGSRKTTILLMAHLDSFFTGACDDATGLAVLVDLARRLSKIPKEQRNVSFIFAGISAHHDEAAGMHELIASDPERYASIESVILLEHLDAQHGDMSGKAKWPRNLNNYRAAYVGDEDWPEIHNPVSKLVTNTGLMTAPVTFRESCIADLFIVCGDKKIFCLMQSPPFYHTNHDTLDKISEEGLQNASDFHWELLKEMKYITPLEN